MNTEEYSYMKKSLLLYTVSGILFCSYPLNANTLQPPSEDSSLERPTKAKAGDIPPEIPTTRGTVSSSESEPELRLSLLSAQSPTTSNESTENLQSRLIEPTSLRNGVGGSTTNTTKPKSRRRPSAESPLPNSTTEQAPPPPPVSTRPTSAEPAAPIPPTPMPAAPAKPAIAGGDAAPSQPEKPIKIEDINSALEVHNGETVTHHNVKIYDKFVAVDARGKNSTIKLIGGTVSSDFIALSTSEGGSIDATNITVRTPLVGLLNTGGTISLKDSTVNVTGDQGTSGIVFRSISAPEEQNAHQEKGVVSKVMLKNTKLFVKNGVGIGIYGTSVTGEVNLKDSEIHADVLVKNQENTKTSLHTLTVNADHSVLEGRVSTEGNNVTIFNLNNNAKWLLTSNKTVKNNDKDPSDYEQFGANEKSYSHLSMLNLQESSIVFGKPTGHYQTLFVGSQPQQGDRAQNTTTVYSATRNAEIHLNSKWDNHSPVMKQETDRLVIGGDVSGTTLVHINLQEKDKKRTDSATVWEERMTSVPASTHGISLIQVSGTANENSFKLAGDYMTMGGSPYKYVLAAYAPGTSHASQNLFGKKDSHFWDFRLQNAYVDDDKKIRALLPQVANYLVMPNALFSSGFADANNQNMLLDNMRATVFGPEDNKKSGVFLSTYSEKVTLFSNRDPLHYGYGADVNYNALQLGVILAALEGKDISTHFGLLGTYGKLSFTPKGMEDSEKTTLDKWSLTAYSGIQHSNGLYLNTFLSYGKLKGDITTALIGNAAKLDGTETLSVSATIGQKLATGSKGLMFEPQAQLVYQNLMFDVISDADGFEVDMNNPHQWLVRIGGRLTQNLSSTEENKAVSFYGKLNILRTFGDGKAIQIGDTFYLDPSGSSIEGGIGVNAYLSHNIALHGDISHRKKLQKAGVSGTSFSGGVRYRF